MKAREYYATIQAAILAAPHVIRSDITFDEVTDSECYIRGNLTMTGEIELHLAEYTITNPEIKRLKYRIISKRLKANCLHAGTTLLTIPKSSHILTTCIKMIRLNHLQGWISRAHLQQQLISSNKP